MGSVWTGRSRMEKYWFHDTASAVASWRAAGSKAFSNPAGSWSIGLGVGEASCDIAILFLLLYSLIIA
jgi:hypothetical protein